MTAHTHDLLSARWSPREFANRDIDDDTLRSLLEAARWAPSCFNEQPWRFVVGRRQDGDTHARLATVLVDRNREWAQHAPLLVLSAASMTFARNGKPNRHAFHDVGLAVATMTVQATSMGLAVHQMAGFDRDAARTAFAIPDDVEPVAMIAIGYYADAATRPDSRARRPLVDTAFAGTWGDPVGVVRSAP